jgi:hypothetical protein
LVALQHLLGVALEVEALVVPEVVSQVVLLVVVPRHSVRQVVASWKAAGGVHRGGEEVVLPYQVVPQEGAQAGAALAVRQVAGLGVGRHVEVEDLEDLVVERHLPSLGVDHPILVARPILVVVGLELAVVAPHDRLWA